MLWLDLLWILIHHASPYLAMKRLLHISLVSPYPPPRTYGRFSPCSAVPSGMKEVVSFFSPGIALPFHLLLFLLAPTRCWVYICLSEQVQLLHSFEHLYSISSYWLYHLYKKFLTNRHLVIVLILNKLSLNNLIKVEGFFTILFIHSFIYLLEGKEKERKRNTNVWLPFTCPQLGTWPATQACARTGN